MVNQEIELQLMNEKQLAMEAYLRVLQNAYNHPFVNEASQEMRRNGLQYYYANRSYPTVIRFMYGSVCRGQAHRYSDLDLFDAFVGGSINLNHFSPEYAVKPIPPGYLAVFCPALGEFDEGFNLSGAIHEGAQAMRKEVISKMYNEYIPRYQLQMWNVLKDKLGRMLLPDNTRKFIHNKKKVDKDRRRAVAEFWEQVLANDSTGRADKFYTKYQGLNFPDWETMKLAFL